MKRLIFLSILVVSAINIFAGDPIDLTKYPIPPPHPIPNSLTQELPVSATISDSQLSVYFETSVGDATITVYDESDQIIYQETVDTDSTSTVFISSSSWSAGNYSITITYGTTTLRGDFSIE